MTFVEQDIVSPFVPQLLIQSLHGYLSTVFLLLNHVKVRIVLIIASIIYQIASFPMESTCRSFSRGKGSVTTNFTNDIICICCLLKLAPEIENRFNLCSLGWLASWPIGVVQSFQPHRTISRHEASTTSKFSVSLNYDARLNESPRQYICPFGSLYTLLLCIFWYPRIKNCIELLPKLRFIILRHRSATHCNFLRSG